MPIIVTAVEWGTAPDWVAAVGSVGAMFLVGGGLLWEVHRRRVDDERLAVERRDDEASQARLVTLQAEGHPATDWRGDPLGGDPLNGVTAVEVTVTNDSSAPILNLDLRELRFAADDVDYSGQAATSDSRMHLRLAAHSNWTASFHFSSPRPLSEGPRYRYQLEFTDAHGRRWRRRGTEQPVRVINAPAVTPDNRDEGDLQPT
jgi:hypothetical protein